MADSDGEYNEDDVSSDDAGHQAATRQGGANGRKRKDARDTARAWEKIKRPWDTVEETADGRLTGFDTAEAEIRRRLLRDTTPLQRGIIRHLVLVLDMSFAMLGKDYLPNLYRVAMRTAIEFVREYFEQNPISQLGILGMRDGVAVRISDLGGNPAEHIEKLRSWEMTEPQGNPSLQNALEMCRGQLFHAPSHGTREVLVIFGALLSSDPGDIHDTIASLVADRVRVSVIGLSAHLAICSEICRRTNGGAESAYHVALHDVHFRDLFLDVTTPPVTRAAEHSAASLLQMGFPSRTLEATGVSICACHNKPIREGYGCTRCGSKVCRLPAECPACGLTLILSTHLARSYHHLFPLRNWVTVAWADATSRACHGCLAEFPVRPQTQRGSGRQDGAADKTDGDKSQGDGDKKKSVSESGRYACEVCGNHFCIDCDAYAHEVVHNCPGCQSDTRGMAMATNGAADTNGDAMMVDS